MKYILTALFALFLVGCGELSTKEIATKNLNGVVLITNQIDTTSGGLGTGFILKDNMILTNNHVIEGNGKLNVYLPDSEKKYEAAVVYTDPVSDMAIIRVKDWEKFKEEQHPVNLTLGDSDALTAGDKVVVIGHPWGLAWSVSDGIVSAKNRKLDTKPKFIDQIDAKIYQGNSGGPIFDEHGNVVCVSNLMLAKEGGSYGFCIPSSLVKKFIHDYNVLKEVRWRVMNIQIEPNENGEVVVKGLEAGGAADKAGIKENDKIIEVNGTAVKTINNLMIAMSKLYGDVEMIKVLVIRDGQELMINVKTNYKTAKDFT